MERAVRAVRDAEWARVDYYGALGVSPAAANDEIDRAFRAKLMTGDVELLASAHAVLSDPRLRRDYDEVRSNALTSESERRARTLPTATPRAYAGRLRRDWLVIATAALAVVYAIAWSIAYSLDASLWLPGQPHDFASVLLLTFVVPFVGLGVSALREYHRRAS